MEPTEGRVQGITISLDEYRELLQIFSYSESLLHFLNCTESEYISKKEVMSFFGVRKENDGHQDT